MSYTPVLQAGWVGTRFLFRHPEFRAQVCQACDGRDYEVLEEFSELKVVVYRRRFCTLEHSAPLGSKCDCRVCP
nr:hypothetical protein Iba_chr02eCG5940 [Ipomoea batatas]